jgi:hypothetical protein
MVVRALVSFAGKGFTVTKGQILTLPDGADWLNAGLVEEVGDQPESAMEATPKPRTKRPAAKKSTAKKKI